MFFTGAALWCVGGFKHSNEVATWIGLGLNGLFVSGIIIPMIPELMGTTEAFIKDKQTGIVSEEKSLEKIESLIKN